MLRHLSIIATVLTISCNSAFAFDPPQGMTVQHAAVDWEAVAKRLKGKELLLPTDLPPDVVRKIDQSDTPVLLPSEFLQGLTTKDGSLIDRGTVTFRNSDAGYTAVLKAKVFDVTVVATDEVLIDPKRPGAENIGKDFTSPFSATYGGGGQISFGRYGAFYNIEFICHKVSNDGCVTEKEAFRYIEHLITLGGKGVSSASPN